MYCLVLLKVEEEEEEEVYDQCMVAVVGHKKSLKNNSKNCEKKYLHTSLVPK